MNLLIKTISKYNKYKKLVITIYYMTPHHINLIGTFP